ncbi:EpsG family protein [Flavobacterium sp.]|uniref:EpsG family protein n=1 Tax=Flavobacterium sp. TaxID=239 RepID=UPI0037525454
MQSLSSNIENSNNLSWKNLFGVFLMIILILFIGLRPLNYRFGDMVIYYNEFQRYATGASFDGKKDFIFECFKYIFAKFSTASVFFFVCILLYVLPLYYASKKLFKKFWFYGFLMLVISFSFLAYGVNGIRNGIATSLFIFAVSRDKWLSKSVLFVIMIFIHKSLIIPIIVCIIVSKFSNTKLYLLGWFLAIPLSLVLGSFWETFFLGLGFGDEKLDGYLGGINQASEGVKLVTGFRWDFLLYSTTGIFAGWYYIIKRKFDDKTYILICNTYIIANAFWILVIRASYSNRFAYLSWFLLGLVIIYPLLKSKFSENQHRIVGFIVLAYFAFTYLLNVILEK